jgi:MoaD family protein
MRITVRTYLTLKNIVGDHPLLETGAEIFTIKDLLKKLSAMAVKKSTHPDLDPETETGGLSVQVLVNGRDLRQLPKGMDTELKEGDNVSIFPQMAGG